ncbi:MAG: TIR domain-containing protein [Hyphomonadaceae bacterium]
MSLAVDDTSRKYRAFFSYARADARIANWLFRALDTYKTPRSMVSAEGTFGPVPSKLHPIFRDKEDLSGGGSLPERLNAALEDSDALVVLCTPHSATRRWVNEEILAFQRLGRGDRIFPVIASSNPEQDVDRPSSDYLPPALKDSGLLAADLREIKRQNGQIVGDGREGGKLKLIAGLLGMPLDALARRERLRQRAQRLVLVAASFLFAILALGASISAVESEDRANRALMAESEYLARTSVSEFERGNYTLAFRLALEGSPLSSSAPGRPFSAAIEAALMRVVHADPLASEIPIQSQLVRAIEFGPHDASIIAFLRDENAERSQLFWWNIAGSDAPTEAVDAGNSTHMIVSPDHNFLIVFGGDDVRMFELLDGAPRQLWRSQVAIVSARWLNSRRAILVQQDGTIARADVDSATLRSIGVTVSSSGLNSADALSLGNNGTLGAVGTDGGFAVFDVSSGNVRNVVWENVSRVILHPTLPFAFVVSGDVYEEVIDVFDFASWSAQKTSEPISCSVSQLTFADDGESAVAVCHPLSNGSVGLLINRPSILLSIDRDSEGGLEVVANGLAGHEFETLNALRLNAFDVWATIGREGSVRFWSGSQFMREWRPHAQQVQMIASSSDGQLVVSVGLDIDNTAGSLRLWQMGRIFGVEQPLPASVEERRTLQTGVTYYPETESVALMGNQLVQLGADNRLTVHDLMTGATHAAGVDFAGAQAGTVRLLDARDGIAVLGARGSDADSVLFVEVASGSVLARHNARQSALISSAEGGQRGDAQVRYDQNSALSAGGNSFVFSAWSSGRNGSHGLNRLESIAVGADGAEWSYPARGGASVYRLGPDVLLVSEPDTSRYEAGDYSEYFTKRLTIGGAYVDFGSLALLAAWADDAGAFALLSNGEVRRSPLRASEFTSVGEWMADWQPTHGAIHREFAVACGNNGKVAVFDFGRAQWSEGSDIGQCGAVTINSTGDRILIGGGLYDRSMNLIATIDPNPLGFTPRGDSIVGWRNVARGELAMNRLELLLFDAGSGRLMLAFGDGNRWINRVEVSESGRGFLFESHGNIGFAIIPPRCTDLLERAEQIASRIGRLSPEESRIYLAQQGQPRSPNVVYRVFAALASPFVPRRDDACFGDGAQARR